jgi:hypothetical protein
MTLDAKPARRSPSLAHRVSVFGPHDLSRTHSSVVGIPGISARAASLKSTTLKNKLATPKRIVVNLSPLDIYRALPQLVI